MQQENMRSLPDLRAGRESPYWRKALRPLARNRLVLAGTLLAVLMVMIAVFADILAPFDPLAMNSTHTLEAPSIRYLFGTDRYGRDILSRAIYGSRISLWVGIASISISMTLGTTLGLISGFFGGWTDNTISRIMDVAFSFPGLLLAIAIAAVLGPSLNNAVLAIAVVYTPPFSRIVRGSVLAERDKEYVDAARLIGARAWRIMGRHVLPNVVSPIIVQGSVGLSLAILTESYLSYLGLGTQPPHPSWGTMLSEGRTFLETAPWISIFPGLAIVLTVLAFNILGDGLRDVLDPKMRSA